MLDRVLDGECACQDSVWTKFDLGKSCVRQMEKLSTMTQRSFLQHGTSFSGWGLDMGIGYAV